MIFSKIGKKYDKKENNLRDLVYSMSTVDQYFLDEDNAIVVVDNFDNDSNNKYIMIHYRLVNGKLCEINRWYQRTYYLGPHDTYVKKKFNLFMVQGGHGVGSNSHNCPCAVYNYKLDKFVVPKGQFDCIGTNNWVSGIGYRVPGPDYLEEYNSFLAYFSLRSTYEDGDVISYKNPVTCENITYNFNVHDELYFALLTPDGTIRGNKLFRGCTFSRIGEIIDLDKYSSLDEFKQKRVQVLNQKKNKAKEEYYQKLKTSGKEYISPYMDQEVLKVLKRGKTNS